MKRYRFPFHGFGQKGPRIDYIEKSDYALRGVSEFLYNSTRRRNWVRLSPVKSLGRTAQKHVLSGIASLGRLASLRGFLRSASVTVKFGIKAGVLLSSLVLAFVFVVGCNSDETTPPVKEAGIKAPSDTKAPAATPTPKPDDKK